MNKLYMERSLTHSKKKSILFESSQLKTMSSHKLLKHMVSRQSKKVKNLPGLKFSVISKKSIFQEIMEKSRDLPTMTQLNNQYKGMDDDCVGCISFSKANKEKKRQYSRAKDQLKELKNFKYLFPSNENCKVTRQVQTRCSEEFHSASKL